MGHAGPCLPAGMVGVDVPDLFRRSRGLHRILKKTGGYWLAGDHVAIEVLCQGHASQRAPMPYDRYGLIRLTARVVHGDTRAARTMHQVFEDELHDYFGIPTEYGVVVTMPIGYPLGNFGPVTRIPAEQMTHYDRW